MEECKREEGLQAVLAIPQPLPVRAPTFPEELPVLPSQSLRPWPPTLPPREGLFLRPGQPEPPVSWSG